MQYCLYFSISPNIFRIFFPPTFQLRRKGGQSQSFKCDVPSHFSVSIKKYRTVGAGWEMDVLGCLNKVDFTITYAWVTLCGVAVMALFVPLEHIHAEQILHDKCLAFIPSRAPTFRTNCHHIAHIAFLFSPTWVHNGSCIFQPFSHRFHEERRMRGRPWCMAFFSSNFHRALLDDISLRRRRGVRTGPIFKVTGAFHV